MKTFIIPGEVVSKKNSNKFNAYTKRVYKDARYRTWREMASLEFMMQRKGFSCRSDQVEIDLVFFHGDNRRRDSDNGVTSIFDTMKELGIIEDDAWRNIPTHISENFNCHSYGVKPQVVIMIKPYNPQGIHLAEALEAIKSRSTSQASR